MRGGRCVQRRMRPLEKVACRESMRGETEGVWREALGEYAWREVCREATKPRERDSRRVVQVEGAWRDIR